MILKCINIGGYHLTIDKIYEAEICLDAPSEVRPGEQVFDYYIINDKGIRHGVQASFFKNISEIREEKLNELGI
jgi:hypothetical protein